MTFTWYWFVAFSSHLQDINKEETLLEKEQSQFPMLQTLMGNKQPYDQLWTNALNFQNKSEIWMNGTELHTGHVVKHVSRCIIVL